MIYKAYVLTIVELGYAPSTNIPNELVRRAHAGQIMALAASLSLCEVLRRYNLPLQPALDLYAVSFNI